MKVRPVHVIVALIGIWVVWWGVCEVLTASARPKWVPRLRGQLEVHDDVVGTGPAVKPGDTVSILYTGKFTNGEVFDSTSHRNNTPFEFQVGAEKVVAGMDQGVQGMRVGGKRTIAVPYNLGYGPDGDGAMIPPKSDLIFDVSLRKVTPGKLPASKAQPGAGAPAPAPTAKKP